MAFTGNRDLKHPAVKNSLKLRALIELSLKNEVVELYHEGFTTFLSGMAVGFDLLAARVVLDLRAELPDLKLVAVVPFSGQADSFSTEERDLYDRVVAESDECYILAEEYSPMVYHQRNDFLVEHSSHVVAYSCGEGRGTLYTIKQALKRGSTVDNLYGSLLPPHTLGRLF